MNPRTVFYDTVSVCKSCNIKPQLYGSLAYPHYSLHCVRCGTSTSTHDNQYAAREEWNMMNT